MVEVMRYQPQGKRKEFPAAYAEYRATTNLQLLFLNSGIGRALAALLRNKYLTTSTGLRQVTTILSKVPV